ncbi:MAG: cobalamin 5'-phosphate synthase [Chloroflexi bacterium RBG_16_56_11]|nr:MAG: cobalamin 5'-phosphate synthase [Chloroflexi bacterium RBG_16_56_11]
MTSFLAAIQFLTSLPVKRDISPQQLGRAAAFFPAVGLVIGLVLAGLNWLLLQILPPAVVDALLIVTLVLVTGALHLDGFADTCDGLAGHRTVEERLKIMRDSRTGAFGVVGIVLLLLVKYVSLNNVPVEFTAAILIFLPVVSRWAMVYAVFAFRYARPSGLGLAYKQSTRLPQFTIATLTTLAVAAALFPFLSVTGFLLIAGIWIVATLLSIYFRHKFAGLTGDSYGAINEVSEVMTLVFFIVIWTVADNLI